MKKLSAILLVPMLLSAEPGPATQYLINEPAVLLDAGMMRLQALTTEFEERVGLYWTDSEGMQPFRAEVHASYEPADDRIYVSFSVMNSEPTEAQMAEGCRYAMMQMNIWLLKSLPRLFLHTAYDESSVPADFYSELEDMFELRCYFSSGHDSSKGRFWAYRKLGPLGGDQMTIGQWKLRHQVSGLQIPGPDNK